MKTTNLFISLFLSALLFTFFTDGKNWPFMAYDMYAGNFSTIELSGITKSGAAVKISSDHYFRYLDGYHFGHALLDFHNDHPDQFARIVHELRERYNRGASDPIARVYATVNVSGLRRPLPEVFL